MKLNAEKREPGQPGKLRAQGRVPGVVYGHHAKPVSVALDSHEFQRVLAKAGRTHLVDLVVDEGRAHKVLIKEVQFHPRRQGPIHVDLQQVSLKEKLQVEVPIAITGEAPAVKRGDADLMIIVHALKVECLPGDIPESIEVDVSGLDEVDAGIRVADLHFNDGVTVMVDGEEMVVKAQARRDMIAELEAEVAAEAPEEAAGEEEAAEEEAAEPGAEAEAQPETEEKS